MKLKRVEVAIEGTMAVLQHRFSEEAEQGKGTRRQHVQRGTPREEAEKVAYRGADSTLYMPATCITRLLRDAGEFHKQKGSRKSLKYIVPAAVLIHGETIPLLQKDRTTPINNFEVDSRPVVIPATKGRVMRHRPRVDAWTSTFELKINELVLDEAIIRQLLNEGGLQQGIGDFRPQRGGPFGTFDVVHWQVLKN